VTSAVAIPRVIVAIVVIGLARWTTSARDLSPPYPNGRGSSCRIIWTAGRPIIAGSIKQGGAGDTSIAGTTEDKDRFDGTDSNMVIGHEAADNTGSRAVGFTNVWLCGAAGVMLVEEEIDIGTCQAR
jgi:hypothetical protein